MTGGTVAESSKLGHVEELLTFQRLGTAELQHAPANGAGTQVDELRRGEQNHHEKEGNNSAPLRLWVTMAHCMRGTQKSQNYLLEGGRLVVLAPPIR